MKNLKLKNNATPSEVTFSVFSYGGNKGWDWRVHFKTKAMISARGWAGYDAEGNRADNQAEIEFSDCAWDFNEKDLDKLEKWIQKARKEMKQIKEDQKKYG
jgi:hypothetical protein